MKTLQTFHGISRNIQVKGNFFRFRYTEAFYKYKCKITPLDKEEDATRIFYKLISILRPQIQKVHGPFLPLNSTIYSSIHDKPGTYEATLEDQLYKFEMQYQGKVTDDNSSEKFNFLGRMMKRMQYELKMVEIQRKYFDMENCFRISNGNLEIYSGYQSALRTFGIQKNIFVNIDVAYKISVDQTMLFVLENMCRQQAKPIVSSLLEGKIIMTNYYPRRMYRIDSINYEMNPLCSFAQKDNTEINFAQYYKQKYGISIKNLQQPLILNKDRKTGRSIYLIPELCKPTGIEDNIKNNFAIMKEVSAQTKPDPNKRLMKTQEIIRKINECKSICTKEQDEEEKERRKNQEQGEIIIDKTQDQKETEAWMKKKIDFLRGVQINNEPESFNSKQISIQEYSNGTKIIRAGGKPNWERDLQIPLKKQILLNKIAIVHNAHSKDLAHLFLSNLNEAAKQFQFYSEDPRLIEVNNTSLNAWMQKMQYLKDQKCQVAILMLSGPKKAAPLYGDLKRFLTQEAGIPSQIVLESTLKGRGLRSICNKIIVQICAKTGGIPYNILNFPFIDQPSMVVGIDVYHKTFGGVRKSIFAFVATLDAAFTRYFSIVKVQEQGQEIGSYVEDCCTKAIEDFLSFTRCTPKRIIVFRDGVSESQRNAVKTLEIEAIRRACIAKQLAIDLIFMCLDKKTNAKFYEVTNPPNVQNCSPGTIIDDPKVCVYEEFFLISQKTNQGIASPTHYFSLVDDVAAKCQNEEQKMQHKNKLEQLAYKLCYLYFNWTGSIKVPAPCIYAHKLSNLVGDKWPSSSFAPHKNLTDMRSLYFI